ncbi:MAG: hypothetical protein ACK5QW_00645 [Cyanobacteriota bacterium]
MTSSRSSAPAAPSPANPGELEDARALVERLQEDRLWLLRQLDSGRWPQWRLDLAALERELGQLLDQASDRLD